MAAERPLLVLAERAEVERDGQTGGGDPPQAPGRERQAARIGPKMSALEAAFEAKRVRMQASATGLPPEDVLVFETACTVEDFFKLVAKTPGLEFLAEHDEFDIPPDDDFYVLKQAKKKKSAKDEAPAAPVVKGYTGRVYVAFANQGAFQEILKHWARYERGEPFPHGKAKWREIFHHLRDVRPWGVRDRLEESGLLDELQERIDRGEDVVPCEIELWYSAAPRRLPGRDRVRSLVAELGGEVLSQADVPEIRYHALSVRLPIDAVRALMDPARRDEIALIQCEQIQFMRASGQAAIRRHDRDASPGRRAFDGPMPRGVPPRVALLDGLPLQNHAALEGRLVVDDPDGLEASYPAAARRHGTAMASLIVWGDLDSPGAPLPSPLYARPILVAEASLGGDEEVVGEGVLIVDLIHRAVRRLRTGDGDEGPTAPTVEVVNLSFGIRDRPFDTELSPLARLLDWLSWRHQLLFIVSAGNQERPIPLDEAWGALDPEAVPTTLVSAVAADARNRRLLSPAESMNALTIGALHDDRAPRALGTNAFDPFPVPTFGAPSLIGRLGFGYRRSIKPDVAAAGGRAVLARPLESDREVRFSTTTLVGQKVAAPGGPGSTRHERRGQGTSNAAALMSRAAAFVLDDLDALRAAHPESFLSEIPLAVVAKALLAHGARWGAAAEAFGAMLVNEPNEKARRSMVARFVGFGPVDPEQVGRCAATRVTALAGGFIDVNEAFVHQLPLPPSLSGVPGKRRVVVTLAWMTPVDPLSYRWRSRKLWLSTPSSSVGGLVFGSEGLGRTYSDHYDVQRGTLQHEVFEGAKTAVITDGAAITVKVNCREDAKGGPKGPVPYALAVTLEVAEELGLDIYAEVRERVYPDVRVRPRVTVRPGGGDGDAG